MNTHTHTTYCQFHLGDNLFHLHFLRALAKAHPGERFLHYAHECHLPDLRRVVADLDNIVLAPLREQMNWAAMHDAWKNAGAGTPAGGFFENHADRNNYYSFYVDWFRHLAKEMGFKPVFNRVEDLLFDYPALHHRTPLSRPFDVLFVNSQPCSGQFPPMNSDHGEYLAEIIRELQESGRHRLIVTQPVGVPPDGERLQRHVDGVVCTQDLGLSVTGIGNLSLYCHTVIMIGTGPAWPTMNAFNRDSVRHRIVLFDPEFILGLGDIHHAVDRDQLRGHLKSLKLL